MTRTGTQPAASRQSAPRTGSRPHRGTTAADSTGTQPAANRKSPTRRNRGGRLDAAAAPGGARLAATYPDPARPAAQTCTCRKPIRFELRGLPTVEAKRRPRAHAPGNARGGFG